MVLKQASSRVLTVSDDFKGSHYPKSVILYAVFFYVHMALPIVTWKRSSGSVASMLTMQH
ncbi:MAG: hypothetical protein ACJAVT_001800 [Yoonia sp.]|jgi:hypothetical protein